MLVANLGLRGVDVLEEVYEQLEVESFFDRGVDQEGKFIKAVPMQGCVHVVRQEMAVVDVAHQPWAVNLGTSGLDRSVALFLACEELSRVGVVHLDSEEAAAWATARLAREVGNSLPLQQAVANAAAGGDGASSSGSGSPGPNLGTSTRGRKTPLIDAFIVGGYQDESGHCEAIIRAVLAGLAESEHRIRLGLVCAGLVNDSQHNGNDEDRRGPRCALVTACTLQLKRSKTNSRFRYVAVPVPGFEDRGPAFVLRSARALLGEASLMARAAAQAWEKRAMSSKYRLSLGEALVVRAFCPDTGRFVIVPFHLMRMDRQSAAVLLNAARANPADFLRQVGAEYVAPSNTARFIADACEVIRFVVANPDAASTFAAVADSSGSGEEDYSLPLGGINSDSSGMNSSASEQDEDLGSEKGGADSALAPIIFVMNEFGKGWVPSHQQHKLFTNPPKPMFSASKQSETPSHPHACLWSACC